MSAERWYADGGTVRDENGLAVAHVVGQDEDNSDTVLLAAAPALLDFARTVATGNTEYDGIERMAREVIALAEGR